MAAAKILFFCFVKVCWVMCWEVHPRSVCFVFVFVVRVVMSKYNFLLQKRGGGRNLHESGVLSKSATVRGLQISTFWGPDFEILGFAWSGINDFAKKDC